MTAGKQTLRSLLAIIFLDQTTITLSFPLMTLIFFDTKSRLLPADMSYADRSMWYGMCVSLPYVLNIFFTPMLSFLSDSCGRKPILLIEIFSAALFALFLGLGVYFGMLVFIFAGLIVKGAFSRSNPTALSIMGDLAPNEKKVLYMGYLQFAIALGAFLGPLLGGYFANRYFFSSLNFSLPFFIAMCFALINTCITYTHIQETLKETKTDIRKRYQICGIKQVFFHPAVLRISLILLLIQFSWSMYYQFMPPILKMYYSFDAHHLGYFIGMIAFWLALATSLVLSFLHYYFSTRQILIIALYLMLTGFFITLYALFNQTISTLWIWAGAAPIASGDVIAFSCLTALYSKSVDHTHQGKAMGVCLIIVSITWAITGYLGGLLLTVATLLPLILSPIGALMSLFMLHGGFSHHVIRQNEVFSTQVVNSN